MRISRWVRAGAMLELGSPWGECGHALLRVGAEEGLQTTEVGGRRRGGWLPACDWHTQGLLPAGRGGPGPNHQQQLTCSDHTSSPYPLCLTS